MILCLWALVPSVWAYDVELAWTKNDTSVTGYRLYGSVNGDALSPISDFNANEIGVIMTELEAGNVYRFTVTSLRGIQESDFSNEVSYCKVTPLVFKGRTITFRGMPGTVYVVEASEDLITWTVLAEGSPTPEGDFIVWPWMQAPKMFFRVRPK